MVNKTSTLSPGAITSHTLLSEGEITCVCVEGVVLPAHVGKQPFSQLNWDQSPWATGLERETRSWGWDGNVRLTRFLPQAPRSTFGTIMWVWIGSSSGFWGRHSELIQHWGVTCFPKLSGCGVSPATILFPIHPLSTPSLGPKETNASVRAPGWTATDSTQVWEGDPPGRVSTIRIRKYSLDIGSQS